MFTGRHCPACQGISAIRDLPPPPLVCCFFWRERERELTEARETGKERNIQNLYTVLVHCRRNHLNQTPMVGFVINDDTPAATAQSSQVGKRPSFFFWMRPVLLLIYTRCSEPFSKKKVTAKVTHPSGGPLLGMQKFLLVTKAFLLINELRFQEGRQCPCQDA
jgi:hypothetical protein